jgi:hypothetical protein
MATINLDKNVKITTFRPPAGFDPLSASTQDLAAAGLPPRPTDPKLLARYERFFNRTKSKFQYIEPTFRVDPTKSTHTNRGAKTEAGTETYDNWSGGVVCAERTVIQMGAGRLAGAERVSHSAECVAVLRELDRSRWRWLRGCVPGRDDLLSISERQFNHAQHLSLARMVPVELGGNHQSSHPGDLVSMLICSAEGAGSTTATIYFGNHSNGVSTS